MKAKRKQLIAFHKESMSSYRVLQRIGDDMIKILVNGEKVTVLSKPFDLILK